MDLLVVGAGVAGVAAALAGARSGLTVLLVEREAALGGTAVHGLIGALCGLYRNGGSTPGEALQGGITAEIAAALLDAAPARELKKVGRVFVLPFAGHELLSLLNDRCRREPRISPCYGSKPVALSVDRGRVTTVTLALADALVTVVPGAVIDASGNGDAAALAGADFDLAPAEQLQLAGFTAKVCGLVDVDSSLSLKVPFAVAKGVEAGAVPARCRYTVFSAAEQAGEGYLKVNLPLESSPDEAGFAAVAAGLVAWLGSQLPQFRQAAVAATSGRAFPREGRRIIGDYLLTAEDVLAARKFPDGIVRGAWPLELWSRDRGVSYRYPPDGDYYEIPAGCIRARGFSNLFMAGRCISVSHEALGSTRVIATCLALGEQAALAATAALRKGAGNVSSHR